MLTVKPGQEIEKSSTFSIEDFFAEIDSLSVYQRFFRGDVRQGKGYSSPFREDKTPSFCIFRAGDPKYVHKGYLWIDQATGEVGDCLDFVAKLYGVSVKEAICLIKGNVGSLKSLQVQQKEVEEVEMVKAYNNIKFTSYPWKDWNKKFWEQFGITVPILNFYNVKYVKDFVVGDKYYGKPTYREPTFCYMFADPDKSSKIGLKLYTPYSKEYKFSRDYGPTVVEGYEQAIIAKSTNLCVITKSLKDVMVLCTLGIPAVSPPSEHATINLSKLTALQNKFSKLIVLFDNDRAGIEASAKFSAQHNIPSIMLPTQYGAKDCAEFVVQYDKEKLRSLLTQLMYDCNAL